MSANELLALGISHKTAPVALRERLAFSESQALDFARALADGPEVSEAVVISTCNRTEVYLVVGDPVRAETEVLGMLAQRAGIRPTELAQHIYSPRNCDAARQLYRVTAGLESMILGEAEIQGQVKRAYESALAAGVTGPLLNRLFAAALTTGKRVRAETGIASSRVSVPSVAVDLAQDVLGSLAERHVVILGAGEMSELTAQALAHQGAGTIFVANRHADRALSLAQRFGGSVVGLDGLPEQLLRADIVVSSTSSPHPIVGAEEVELVMAQRRERARGAERSEGAEPGRHGRGERERSERERGGRRERDKPGGWGTLKGTSGRDLLLIDIAVPRDVEEACGDVEGVTLYDIDDLQAVVERNLGARAEILPRAEEIVEEEIHRFARWLGLAETLPTVAALREHADALVEQILKENAGRWESASERDLMRVEAVARAVVSRLLHEPTIRLRSLSRERTLKGTPHDGGQASGLHASLQLVRELFGLDTPQGGIPHSGAYPEGHTLEGASRQAGDSQHDQEQRGETGGEDANAKLAEVRSIDSARPR
jgi:glutamyl-tRNA reductase